MTYRELIQINPTSANITENCSLWTCTRLTSGLNGFGVHYGDGVVGASRSSPMTDWQGGSTGALAVEVGGNAAYPTVSAYVWAGEPLADGNRIVGISGGNTGLSAPVNNFNMMKQCKLGWRPSRRS
jgi:hypothetical protein